MSVPVRALRQPKIVQKKKCTRTIPDVQYVIVTLRDNQKLVVSSDAYHGIITAGEMYKCVFCETEMKLDSICKDNHKKSSNHLKLLERYPPAENYAGNLIRKLTESSSFCTICNVPVSNVQLMRHLQADVHTQELQKASIRATTYKPS